MENTSHVDVTSHDVNSSIPDNPALQGSQHNSLHINSVDLNSQDDCIDNQPIEQGL